ncbi:NAD(P)-dependent dehydrogenase, short-chain alcohol dehydrogenase family [Desulfocicer vacuolatum DSM 3385]|uniref:NAD(P)-dependent dehydrogenase, short-chain alcohol dehydrogenase family n=1 Tax=Desulfocicer vacuolatum DSM 3385 TaxID=1121400 RepID=A0A1W2CZQ6_9BACT|nr:SDR family NAD(P)-dependent oxidoreductase [Desulfocicer vacuolatum]SMC90218.1 NAD(P)-dependent dehydrogenase, short-chain alcohol dehydrogenase family [Desulfocicer vacuolatum DSM 3385]
MKKKSYIAQPHISEQCKINQDVSKILEEYQRMAALFFDMQCHQDKLIQRIINLQKNMVAAALNTNQKNIDNLKEPVHRLVLKPFLAGIKKNKKNLHFSPEKAILLIGENPDLIHLIKKSLSDFKNPFIHIVPGDNTKILGNNCYQVDLLSPESIKSLKNLINNSFPGIAAIINLLGMTKPYEGKGLLGAYIPRPEEKKDTSEHKPLMRQSHDGNLQDAIKWFLFLKFFIKELKKNSEQEDACLVNFSFMDGQFGLKKEHDYSLGQAGSIGLTKALAREYPQIKVKCIDVDPSASPLYVIARLRQEFAAFDEEIEIGLDGKNRWKLDLKKEEPSPDLGMTCELDSDSVILATGGAYGIVSEILLEIAARYGSKIIILGRSPLPEAESPETKEFQTFTDLQQFLIKKAKKQNSILSPSTILNQVKNILKARQIRRNMRLLKKRCAAVKYHPLDVRNNTKLEFLINNIYERWGRIDGVIHGAGIIEDKRLESKSLESFSRVFETKVLPAAVLEKMIRPDHLKFMVFFSSIASRLGNIGQTDYCAANEILNKFANRLDSKWPGRIVSINWGPWDYGMISEDLRKFFTTKGIQMISVDEGVKMFFEELFFYNKPASEVVISGSLDLTNAIQ